MVRHFLKPAEVAVTLPLIRSGRNGRDWEFQAEDKTCNIHTTRPKDNIWAWNYNMFIGDAAWGTARFDADKAPLLTIFRRKTKSLRRFEGQELVVVDAHKELVTKMIWLDNDDYSIRLFVPSSARKFAFCMGGRRFIWKTKNTITGLDHICRDAATGRMVAHFSNAFLPAKLEGKLRISKEVPTTLIVVLLATCLAYRAWNIEVDTIPAGSVQAHVLD